MLAIDDDPLIRRLFTRALQDCDAEITDAAEALRLMRAGERYDLILCDMEMPGLSGADVYETVLDLDPDQAGRIVFVTGGASGARHMETLAKGRRVLLKPFNITTLLSFVGEELRLLDRPALWARARR